VRRVVVVYERIGGGWGDAELVRMDWFELGFEVRSRLRGFRRCFEADVAQLVS
jgi:hypothetical protein